MDKLETLIKKWINSFQSYEELSQKYDRHRRVLFSLNESPDFYEEIGLRLEKLERGISYLKSLNIGSDMRTAMEQWILTEKEIKNMYRDFIHRLFITGESEVNVYSYAPNNIVLVGTLKQVMEILAPNLLNKKETEVAIAYNDVTGKSDYLQDTINIRAPFYEQQVKGITLVTFGSLNDVKEGILRYVNVKSQKQVESEAQVKALS